MTEVEPDGPALSKSALVALFSCGALLTIGLFSIGPALPQLSKAFSGSPNARLMTEMIGTIAGFTYALSAPIMGVVIARIGCRAVLMICLPVFALAGAAPMILDSLGLILAARVITGVALGGVSIAGMAGISALAVDLRNRMLSLSAIGGGAIALVAFPLVGAISHYQWRWAFLLSLIALPIWLLSLSLPAALGKAVAADKARQTSAPTGVGLLFNPKIGMLLTVCMMLGMIALVAPIYAPLYLASQGITDPRLLSIPATTGALMSMGGAAVYGRLFRKIGHVGIWIVVPIAAGLSLLMAGATHGLVPLTIALMMMNAGIGIMFVDLVPLAVAFAGPSRAAQAIGLTGSFAFGAQILFPFVSAWVSGWAGLSGIFFVFGTAALLIGGVMILWTVLSGRKSPAPA